jgi:hypothetical protein
VKSTLRRRVLRLLTIGYPISFSSPNLEQEIIRSVEQQQYWDDHEHTDDKTREEGQLLMVEMLQFVVSQLNT